MNDREFGELSAGHALHALSAADEAAFQQALAAHPERAAAVQADQDAAALLAADVADQAPPAGIRAALLAQISQTPQQQGEATDAVSAPAAPAAASAPRRPRRRTWFALAACLALLVAIGGGIVVATGQMAPSPAVAALARIDAADDAQAASTTLADGGAATVHWSASVGEAVLVSDGLPSLTDDQTFEMWLVRDGTPLPAGIFDADGDAATAQLAGALQPGDVVAVTVEPVGGSPSGAPTSTPILTIATA